VRAANTTTHVPLGVPQLLPRAEELAAMWRSDSLADIQLRMKISATKANEVQQLFAKWSTQPVSQVPAIDAFIGDIYSGLQTHTLTTSDRAYAHQHMLILSGLYGGLHACDGIMPYRLEMGYKLPNGSSMYGYWGDAVAKLLPTDAHVIVNLSAVEYTKALLPYTSTTVITPKFLTVSIKTGKPAFVTVHTKIARGAFAHWLITKRIQDPSQLKQFTDLGYQYDATQSTSAEPVFICQTFGGLGLSVRKNKDWLQSVIK